MSTMSKTHKPIGGLRLKIRCARADDVDNIDSIVNQFWKPDVDHLVELQNEKSVLLVAEKIGYAYYVEPRLIGTALMKIIGWNKTGYLAELAVHKNYQRRGVATAILRELAQRAKKEGLRAIITETQPANRPAMDFYLKSGFRLCGYSDRYYTNTPRSSDQIALFFSLDI